MVTLPAEEQAMEKIYSVDDVAAVFHVKIRTVREWVTTGRLRASKIGRFYFVKESDMAAFVDANVVAKPKEKKR